MIRNFTFFAERPASVYKKSDPSIFIITFLLWSLGLITLYFTSAGHAVRFFDNSFHFVTRQLMSSIVGFLLLIFFAYVKPEFIRRILPAIVFGSIILCLCTFLPGIGIERNGARRWIQIPYFSTFQPSECIKFSVILFLANYFDKQADLPESQKNIFPAVFGLFVFTSVVLIQQDFSTSVFILLIGIVMFFISGSKLKWIFPVSALAIPTMALMVVLEPYRMNRIIGFLAQDSFQQSHNYQIIAAKKAISNGGIWGQGIGTGLVRVNNVPEVQSDYIFCGWVEAMGLFGVLIYFVLLGIFAFRVIKCAVSCGDRFSALCSLGFGASIVFQSLFNIAVVAGVLPSTGIPLPFFSSGGSSIVFCLAMCGFIINASRIKIVSEV